jgi:hypothetical protein
MIYKRIVGENTNNGTFSTKKRTLQKNKAQASAWPAGKQYKIADNLDLIADFKLHWRITAASLKRCG